MGDEEIHTIAGNFSYQNTGTLKIFTAFFHQCMITNMKNKHS